MSRMWYRMLVDVSPAGLAGKAAAFHPAAAAAMIARNHYREVPEQYRETAAMCWVGMIDRFEADIERAAADVMRLAVPLAANESAAATARMGELYMKWREEGDDAPSIVAITACMAAYLEVGPDTKVAQTLMAGALLAGLPNDKPFHGNAHYRDILSTVFRLVTLHLYLQRMDEETAVLDEEQCAMMLCAACVHDFCHDGRGNNLEGVHTPMRLEKQAFDMAEPVLRLFGLPEDDIVRIRTMVLTTDVSYDDTGSSPSRRLRSAYAYHFEGKKAPLLCPVLAPLKDDKALCLMAMMMEEADIYTSVGLNYDYARMTTVLVAQETKILSTKASTLHGFIEMICGGLLATPAAQHLFHDTFSRISTQAAEDVRLNVDYAAAAGRKSGNVA